MPKMKGKMHYLMMLNARDCVKDKVIGCYLANPSKRETQYLKKKQKKEKPNKGETQIEREKRVKEPPINKVERRVKYDEHKCKLKEV